MKVSKGISRGEFISKCGKAAFAAAFANTALNSAFAAETRSPDKISFSLFSDMHYRAGDYNWATKRLEAILKRAEENNVDFVIQCGDFCHNVKTAAPVLAPYNNFKIPTYHVVGNHDFEATRTLEEVCQAYKMERNYYSFDRGGFRFIVLDADYFYAPDGKLTHYAASSAYDKCHQKTAILPPEQIAFLRERLLTASGPCVIFSHHGFNSASGITNSEEAKAALFESQKHPAMWVSGHYHRNNLSLQNEAAFFVINSPTSDWTGVTHNAYPQELMGKTPIAAHELLYENPVHAIVTMTRDGEFAIDGMKGGWYLGVTPQSIGAKPSELPWDPSVLSSRFKLYPPRA